MTDEKRKSISCILSHAEKLESEIDSAWEDAFDESEKLDLDRMYTDYAAEVSETEDRLSTCLWHMKHLIEEIEKILD